MDINNGRGKSVVTAVCALALPIFAGCGRPGLVGKWQGSMARGGAALPVTMEFRPDGTMTDSVGFQSAAGPMTLVMTDTYAVKGDTLTLTQTGTTVNGRAAPNDPRMRTTRSAAFRVDGDTLTLTPPGNPQSLTLTRVKG